MTYWNFFTSGQKYIISIYIFEVKPALFQSKYTRYSFCNNTFYFRDECLATAHE